MKARTIRRVQTRDKKFSIEIQKQNFSFDVIEYKNGREIIYSVNHADFNEALNDFMHIQMIALYFDEIVYFEAELQA